MNNQNFDPRIGSLDLEDSQTWDTICDGNVIGCFQIESRLGKKIVKQAAPRNIFELANVITIIRPSCLEAKLEDGKSITDHYIARKQNREPVRYFHDALKPILEKTYGLLLTQEQTIRIGTELAGMSDAEADKYLRKGIGKKIPEVIAEARKVFIEGAKKKGVLTEDEAQEIFGWIEKGARYGFNQCLSPESIVTTPEGEKPLKDIVVGDMVLSPTDDYSDEEFVEVIDTIDQGMQDLFEIELEDGQNIQCTMNHKFLASDGVIRTLADILDKELDLLISV